MERPWWLGIAIAVVLAAAGLLAALADPKHWYVMFPLFILGGGAYMVASAPSAAPAGGGPTGRRPTPSFGAPPAVFAGGWGAVVLLTGLVLLVDIYDSSLGWVLLFVWVAALVIVLFVASQVRGGVSHGS